MIRILLLDDEPYVIDWMEDIIERRLAPCYDLMIRKSSSSAEAYAWLRSSYFDLIVSDIRMPGMDGLELVRRLRQNRYPTKVIFLTAFSSFDYAYTAIRELGASYLLKSEEDETVLEHIRRAIDEIRREAEAQRAALLNANLLEVYKDARAMEAYQRREIPFCDLLPDGCGRDGAFQLVLASFGEAEKERFQVWQELRLAILTAIPDLLTGLRLFGLNDGRALLLFRVSAMDEAATDKAAEPSSLSAEDTSSPVVPATDNLRAFLEVVQGRLYEEGSRNVSFAILDHFCRGESGERDFVRLCAERPWDFELNRCAVGGIREIHLPREKRDASEPLQSVDEAAVAGERRDMDEQTEHSRGLRLLSLIDDLRRAFNERSSYDFIRSGQEFLNAVRGIGEAEAHAGWLTLQRVDLELRRFLTDMLLQFSSEVDRRRFAERLRQTEASKRDTAYPDRIEAWLRLADGFRAEIWASETGEKHLITSLKQYIDAHLHENLSLQSLSDHFHYNPSYVSRLFKQESGRNLFEYINERRMNAAAKLLTEEGLDIRETARRVGVMSPQYFSVLFKRMHGFSPQQYLKRYQQNKD